LNAALIFDKFYLEVMIRKDLYNAIINFNNTKPIYDSPEQERYVKFLLREFKRSGVDKTKHTRIKIKKIH